MSKERDQFQGMFRDPGNLAALLRRSGQSEEFRHRMTELIEGPHPSREILLEYARGDLDPEVKSAWSSHITLCPRCSEQVHVIRTRDVAIREASLDGRRDREIDWAGTVRELISEVQFSIQSYARRLKEIWIPEPTPILDDEAACGYQFQKLGSYRCLALAPDLVATRDFVVGDRAVFRMQAPGDGYLTVFMISNEGPPILVFPASPRDNTLIRASKKTEIELHIEGYPGTRVLKAIWTLDKLLEPKRLSPEGAYDRRILSDYASWTTELPPIDWRTGVCEFLVTGSKLTSEIEPILPEQSVVAVKVVQPKDNDAGYWIPLLFTELRNGRARFGWSGVDGADLHELQSRVRQTRGTGFDFHEKNSWKYGKFLLDLKAGDVLIYINMPEQDKCTVMRVWGDYHFDEVWDPEQRGDFRHVVECELVGTFDRNIHIIHPELSKRLKLRGSHWSLNTVKKHVKVLLVSL